MRLFKDYLLLAYLAAILSTLCAFSAAAKSTAIKTADAFIRDNITAPNASWVITDGNTTLSGAAGRDIGPDTGFLWGSVSKPIAGLVAARQACEGRVDLDRPLGEIMAGFQPVDDRARTITLRQLLSHTSGIPPLLDLLDDPTPGRNIQDAVGEIAGHRLFHAPGTAYAYSSANFLLAQAVLEAANGRPYRDLLDQELEMRGAQAITARTDTMSLVGGHQYFVGRPYGAASTYDDLGLAYGYLGGSAASLMTIGRSVARDLASDTPGCDPAKLATDVSIEVNEWSAYGLGWRNSTWNDQTVLWHAGAANGYASFFAVLPETGAVVVVLQNAFGPLHDARLIAPGLGATNILIDNPPSPAGLPIFYWSALVFIAFALIGLLLLLKRPLTRKGAWLRVLLGSLIATAAGLMPQLAGAGSWSVALGWAPDIAIGFALVGGVAIAVVIRSINTRRKNNFRY